MKMINLKIIFSLLILLILNGIIQAQTTTFTYQGRLTDNTMDAQGTYQMQFSLYDMAAGGTQIGSTITNTTVEVINGVFTVQLEFIGSAFDGSDRFLEIAVCKTNCPTYTTLNPRQQITSAPYAIKALNATNADTAANATNADQLDGVAASQYIQEGDSRLTDARTPTAGSANYIQNTTTEQTSSNFHIDGTGRGNIFAADTQFNLGGSKLISSDDASNLFIGFGAGASNTPGNPSASSGTNNVFLGQNAGNSNTTGRDNSFFGESAGLSNTTGEDNSFFGRNAGSNNTTGGDNSFFGQSAGLSNTTGEDNSFFGESAGGFNTTGENNSFFGRAAGIFNTTGGNNSFFGQNAGVFNTTGENNSFFGLSAGQNNRTGGNNSVFGRNADVGSINLTYATAIGSGAVVTASNRIQLGRNASDVVRIGKLGAESSEFLCFNASNELAACTSSPTTGSFIANQTSEQATSNFHIDGTGTGNIFAADTQFNIGASRILGNAGTNNLFAGVGAGNNTTGGGNTLVGASAGSGTTTGSNNTLVGAIAGTNNEIGNNNSVFGANAILNGSNLSYATAIGAGAVVATNNTIKLGREDMDQVRIGKLSNTAGSSFICLNTNKDLAGCSSAPLTNASAFIANQTSQQAASNFHISGTGTADILNVDTQYNIGGNRVIHTFGTDNFFAGANAGNFTMTGNGNTASGANALRSNTTGIQNTANGVSALQNNTTGISNTANGVSALQNNTEGKDNTASGAFALSINTEGDNNTADGYNALLFNTTGDNNTASGRNALFFNTTGNFNTANGAEALKSNTTGTNNIALGYEAGKVLTTGDNNIAIGNVGVSGSESTIRIGTAGTHARAFISGIRGVTTDVNDAVNVVIDSNGQLGTVSSSLRYKSDVADMGSVSDRLMNLRPVIFRYKQAFSGGDKPYQFGLIAEEVVRSFPELVVLNNEGKPETVKYRDLVPLMLNELQKERTRTDTQSKVIEKQQEHIDKLQTQVKKQQTVIDGLLNLICADKPDAAVCKEAK